MHLKVSELASRYRFGVDAIYAWVRSDLIPSSCILRVGNSIRIDSDQFDRLLRAGKLYRPRRRKAEEQARHSREAASALGLSEDQHTTRLEKGQHQHRFMNEAGVVSTDHPYGPTPADSPAATSLATLARGG
jgi:hypothetical protein